MSQESGKIVDWQVFKRIYGFLGPYKLRFWGLVFMILIVACLGPLNPLLIRYTIDNYIQVDQIENLTRMFILMITILIIQTIFNFFTSFIAGTLGQQVIKDIRVKLYNKLVHLKLSFFDQTPIGTLVTRTVSDIETLNEVFSQGLASIAGDLLQLIVIVAAMFYTDWRLTLIILATIPFMLLSTYIFKESIKKSFSEVRTAVANLNAFTQEHITGMMIVQLFNSEKREYNRFKEINDNHRKANIKGIMAYSIYFPVADVISAVAIGLIVWTTSIYILNEQQTAGTLTAFVMFINLFFRPIRMLADRFNTLQMGIVSASRIFTLLDKEDYIQNNGKIISKNFQGNIQVNNLSFAYNEPEYVVKNVSFEVKKGEKIAIVGATGAGKSSIIGLVSRMYDPQSGEILFDGLPLKEYELESVRQQLAVVLQDVFLFSNSIAYNIHLGDNRISQEAIEQAAKAVGIHRFIESLPGGYDHVVSERGASISVGQRQLISFVRALVRNPKLIILDEATSSVDSESELMITQAIQTLLKGRTAIVIAHRLSTIKNADTILVMDKGEIKERGSHEILLEKGGLYKQLYELQFTKEI